MSASRTESVVILGYHAIERGSGPVCLAPSVFERQVRTLHEHGWNALGIDEVAARIRDGVGFVPRSVALTFDDGYLSVHRTALPLLRSLGMVASVFPVTAHLGGHNAWDVAQGADRLELMGLADLRALQDAGWVIGSHTHTHRRLVDVAADVVAEEMERSREVLERRLGVAAQAFAYPYGGHDAVSREVAAQAFDISLAIGAAIAGTGSDLGCVERVDAWYVRRAWQIAALDRALGIGYLAARRALRAVGTIVRSAR